MKKIILSAFSAFCVFAASNANAQDFTATADTIYYTVNGAMNVHNDLTAHVSTVTVAWNVTYNNIPSDWKTGLGICDNVACYPSSILNGTTTDTTAPFSSTCDFHLQLDLTNATTSGTYYVTLHLMEVGGAGTMKNITFAINRWPTGISKVNRNADVTLYPNPAINDVNLVFDPNAGIRNVAVYNLIGKQVSAYRVAGSSARLDLGNVPSGIYFVRLMDAQGNVVTTKKFTHQ